MTNKTIDNYIQGKDGQYYYEKRITRRTMWGLHPGETTTRRAATKRAVKIETTALIANRLLPSHLIFTLQHNVLPSGVLGLLSLGCFVWLEGAGALRSSSNSGAFRDVRRALPNVEGV